MVQNSRAPSLFTPFPGDSAAKISYRARRPNRRQLQRLYFFSAERRFRMASVRCIRRGDVPASMIKKRGESIHAALVHGLVGRLAWFLGQRLARTSFTKTAPPWLHRPSLTVTPPPSSEGCKPRIFSGMRIRVSQTNARAYNLRESTLPFRLHVSGIRSAPQLRAVPKERLHHVCTPAYHDQKIRQAGVAQPFHDMLQDRFAAHLQHRFGEFRRELAHPRSAACSEKNSFIHDLVLKGLEASRSGGLQPPSVWVGDFKSPLLDARLRSTFGCVVEIIVFSPHQANAVFERGWRPQASFHHLVALLR